MKIGINCGHTLTGAGSGAAGILMESVYTRLIGYNLMDLLNAAGNQVIDCTIDEAKSGGDCLVKAVSIANRQELDWFISIHLNASPEHTGQGSEIYTYHGHAYQEANFICANLERLGFRNRGIKEGNSLYVIKNTKAKAMLIEVFFCDHQQDVDTFLRIGEEKTVAQAIFNGLQPFEDYVGKIAQEDWKRRKICLPSVVVAQAIKESARGTSELAVRAKALFGIKKNGWTGKTYIKTATEQKPDGSYYQVDRTEWRAYDNWKDSILDHNDYLATRSTDGGKTLRYGVLKGCSDYREACRLLQELGYATSLSYAESLIHDYIEKYKLYRYDTC